MLPGREACWRRRKKTSRGEALLCTQEETDVGTRWAESRSSCDRHTCVSGLCPEGAVEWCQQLPSQEIRVAHSEFRGTRRIPPSDVFVEQWFKQLPLFFGDFSGSKTQGYSESSGRVLNLELFQTLAPAAFCQGASFGAGLLWNYKWKGATPRLALAFSKYVDPPLKTDR